MTGEQSDSSIIRRDFHVWFERTRSGRFWVAAVLVKTEDNLVVAVRELLAGGCGFEMTGLIEHGWT